MELIADKFGEALTRAIADSMRIRVNANLDTTTDKDKEASRPKDAIDYIIDNYKS